MSSTAETTETTNKLYFGYGSNLWKAQMALRCPVSKFVGLGRLRGYRWMINSRGYANIAQLTNTPNDNDNDNNNSGSTGSDGPGSNTEVYGLIYSLTPADEARLDINEGVPVAYEKRMVSAELFPPKADSGKGVELGGTEKGEVVPMLVYIDFKRTSGDGCRPRLEYIHRMNMGIRDGLEEGLPKGYVDGVMRRWIPEEDLDEKPEGEEGTEKNGGAVKGKNGGAVKELAMRQAMSFQDESGVITRTGSGLGK